MLTFSVETIVLLCLAYLLGCAVGCLARRIVGAPQDLPARQGAKGSPGVTVPASHPGRNPSAQELPAPARAEPVRDGFRRADTLFPAPPPAETGARASAAHVGDALDLQGTIARFETALDGPRRTPIRPQDEVHSTAHPAPATPRDTFAQDLKRIRGIGALLELKLKAAGVCRYEQIAAWTDVDIARISMKLGLRGRIEQERWVEQARGLAGLAQTVPAGDPARDGPTAERSTSVIEPSPANVALETVTVAGNRETEPSER